MDSDSQIKRLQGQVTLPWNVVSWLSKKKGNQKPQIYHNRDWEGKLFDLSELNFFNQKKRMVMIITIRGCKDICEKCLQSEFQSDTKLMIRYFWILWGTEFMMLLRLILIFKCHISWRSIHNDINNCLTAPPISNPHPSLHSGKSTFHKKSI